MEPLHVDADLPPAARHVAHVLQERGPCSQPELVETTTLPESTVDDALQRLADAAIVTTDPRIEDGRGQTYRLTG